MCFQLRSLQSGIIVTLLVILLSCDSTVKLEGDKRDLPNILFAIADDQSFPHAGIYGFSAISTPAFDRVANNGILFTNAFVAAPQCSPSRAAILTGKNIWQLEEAGTHASSFPRKFQVFTDLLESTGYKLGYTGKPWGPGNWEISGWHRNPVGPGYNEKIVSSVPASGINSNDYFGNFAAFIEEMPADKPFFFWYGSREPHRGYEFGSGLRSGMKLENAVVPIFLPDDVVTRNDILDYGLEIEYFDQHLGKMLELLEERGQLHNTIIVVTADNGMPFPYAKANLQEYGTHVPLSISWPKVIKQPEISNELVSLIDLAPTFLEIAGVENIPEMTGKSIVPILYSENSEYPIRDFVLTGRERHTHARPDNLGYPSRAIRTREYLFVKNYYPGRWPAGDPAPQTKENDTRNQVDGYRPIYPGYHDIDGSPSKKFMMNQHIEERDRLLFELAFEKRPMEQLYDIKSDPECLYDLSANPAYSKIREDLRAKLDHELRKEGDPRMFGSQIFDSYPRYSPMRNFDGFNEQGKYNNKYKN